MGTRNNPSPGGPRGGLETLPKKTRTRKQPVRAPKAKPVQEVLDSTEEVATMTQTQPQQETAPLTFEPSTSQPPSRYNTRSSRSVSPSILHNNAVNDRLQDPKGKSVSRSRAPSRSGSSTQQGVEPSNARGGKRKAAKDISEADDAGEGPSSKRAKTTHTQAPQPLHRKRTRRNQISDSPIVEVEEEQGTSEYRAVKRPRDIEAEEEQDASEHRAVKRSRDVELLPQEKHTFSYEHINTSPRDAPQSAPEQAHVQTREESSSRTPQPTSTNSSRQVQTPAQAESSQHDVAESRPRIAEERAINGTPTSSISQQPVIERTDAQSNDSRSDAYDASHQRPAPRNRSKRTPPLPTLKHPHTPKQPLNTDDYLSDEDDDLNDTPAERETYLQKRFGKHRTRVLQPHTKAILSMGPVEIYDESEHEEDIENPFTRDEFQEWKMDVKVAKKAYHNVLGGERLPSPEPSSIAKGKQITRRKLGKTPPASRPNKLRALIEWEQSSEHNSLPSKERLIGLLDASKSEEMNGARSFTPSALRQRTISQPPSENSIRHSENLRSVQDNESGAAGVHHSGDELSNHHSEIKHPAEDVESDAMGDKPSDDEARDDIMSENQSEVDANEAAPTTPIQSPSQRVPESRAWSVFSKVKNVVASPFKFFGRYQNAGSAATTNGNETEFTFTHPHEFSQPLTTPTRSSKQRSKPQSERRGTTTSRRVNQSARAPQTERLRRHVDKSQPLHLRGAPSASDMQNLHEQQASTRHRQRESEIASLEQNDLSHGKSFRVPDSDDSDDDDDDDDDDEGDNQDQASEDDELVNSAPKKWDFLVQTKPDLKAPVQAEDLYVEQGSQSIGGQAERRSRLFPNKEDFPNVFPNARQERSVNSANDQATRSFGDPVQQPQYVYETIPETNYRLYRKINISDENDVCLNMFGEEAMFTQMRDGSYRKIETSYDLTKGKTWEAVRAFERNPGHQATEKRIIEAKWARLGKERRRGMGVGEPASTKESTSAQTIQATGSTENTSAQSKGAEASASANESTSAQSIQTTGSTENNSAQSKGAEAPVSANENTSASSEGYWTRMMRQVEKEAAEAAAAQSSTNSRNGSPHENASAQPIQATSPTENNSAQSVQETGSTLQQKSWNQTPPPKPRPSNAQLPQPTAAELALANANKYQPKKPSGLRNVTQMSPLQLEQENRAQEAEETEEVEEELGKITEYPVVWLPEPVRMEYPVPEGFPGTWREFSEEIEEAVDVAWVRMHPA